jgi:hypothetical protein
MSLKDHPLVLRSDAEGGASRRTFQSADKGAADWTMLRDAALARGP